MDEDKLKNARAAWEGGRRFAQQFSGFMMAIDLLKEVADIQQATSEAQGRLDAVLKAADEHKQKHQADLAALQSDYGAKREEAERTLKEAQARAASVDTETKAIVDAAHAQAKTIVDEAGDRANRAVTEGNVAVAAIVDRLNASQQQISTLRQELASLTQERDSRKAELDAVHSSIAKLAARQ